MTLKDKIIAANKTYRLGRPIITDAAFDALCEEYEKTVSPEEYKAFRDSLHEDTGKVRHPYMMGSLDKLKAEEPAVVNAFLSAEASKRGMFSISAKVDGISCRVHYNEMGEFENAATRGDGSFGIDCTDKVANIIPKEIFCDEVVDIRGELVVTFEDFEKYFKPRGFKNPRNTCAGIMNQKDWKEEDIKHITFVPYEIMGGALAKSEQFEALLQLGFTPAWNTNVKFTAEEINSGKAVAELMRLAGLPFAYPTDGLVISVADYKQELDVYRPKHQMAFKLNQESGWTEVIGVDWGKPSKDGRMTPVAMLAGVEIAGSRITRVTLNNLDWMRFNDIRIGSRVLICKSGDVIPKIIAVDNEWITRMIEIPTVCPVCGAKLVTRDDVDLCCSNEDCPSRKYEKILTFITNLGIQHVSRATLESWYLDSVEKLLTFHANPSSKLETRFERDLRDKLFCASEDTIFKALPFTGLAEKTLTKIIDFYGYRELESGLKTFESFPEGVAEKTMESFVKDAERNFKITQKIIASPRWNGKMYEKSEPKAVPIKGSVCFTGALRTMSHSEAQAAAKAFGYEVKSGVSKGLTYLVTNSTDETSKFKKAKLLGIKIITEDDFVKMLF